MMGQYDNLDRETLVRLLQRRDAERQLGLVWERDEIEADRALNDDYVALDLDPALSHGDAPWGNLVIEGDNFDALRALRVSHKGAIRCIYIDPPYNTGNRDFVYNDRFVDKTHRFRHSLWLEFMYRRLTLAKELLADDGVIFVSIDDNELFRLGMLMDRVFGPDNFVAQFIWRKVDSPNDNKVAVTSDHEYLLCYAAKQELLTLVQKEAPEIIAAYGQQDNEGRRYRDRLLKKNGANSLRRDRPSMFFAIPGPDGVDVWPIHDNGEEACWAKGRGGVAAHIADGTLVWKQREKLGRSVWEPYTREYAPANPSRPWPTIWADLPTMRQAKALLREIFQTADLFSTPKPVELIERVLRVIGDKTLTVLDFFAGSGTTAHAVAKLNAEDGGTRQFILVSSTEATEDTPDKNLCRDVCAQRVRKVLGGYTNAKGEAVAGLGGGFAYLRARRVPKHRLTQKLDHPEIWNALQLLHARPLSVWPGEGFAVEGDGENAAFAYLANAYPASAARLQDWLAARGERPAVIYSWAPERYRTAGSPHDWRPIPQHLRERFGR
ncbi:MAG: site-specific DNA-methyltransferase [Lysobacteraceae bacterium]